MPSVRRLRVEGVTEPIGIDVQRPRFSWIVEASENGVQQVSYRLTVERVAPAGAETVWDSGPVTSSDARSADYDGEELLAGTGYRWRITVVTSAGEASARASFRTGLFREQDWGGAMWIGGHSEPASPGAHPAPLLRREFVLPAPIVSAQLYVAAGGYADVRINGRHAPRGVLAPGFTDYDCTVQYDATEVAQLLRPGRNAVSLELGRGFYGMTAANTWQWQRSPWHAEPCARAVLIVSHEDDTRTVLTTDGAWRTADGPTTFDDLYAGESFDFRRVVEGVDRVGFDDSGWRPAAVVSGPRGELRRQRQPPIVVAESLMPSCVTRLGEGTYLVEFSRTIAGWVTVAAAPVTQASVQIGYAESLRADGTANTDDPHSYYDGRFQTAQVEFAGTGERQEWAPKFTYYGFRYVQLTGWPDDHPLTADSISAQCVHTDVEPAGSFRSSEPLLNDIHRIVVDTVLNNLHGIPTDTPTFEKNGWTGDGMVGAELMLLNFDAHELLAKWAADIAATARHTGIPRVIAPHGGWSYDWGSTPTWNAAMPLIAWWLYLYAADERTMATHLDTLVRHARLELERADAGIAATTLGDWVAPDASPGGGNPPEDSRVPATAFLHQTMVAVARAAETLGRTDLANEFRAHADRIAAAFRARFFDPDRNIVRGEQEGEFRQSHNVLALAFGLIPAGREQAAADAVAADVVARGFHLNTGALGTKYLLPMLSRHGHAQTALRVALQTSYPSWGFWLEHGATTTWEHWALASRSRGHYFLGTVDDWLYHDVAGIRPVAPGYRIFEIAPAVTSILEAQASVSTAFGTAAVHWRRQGHEIALDATVPVGAEAILRLPGTEPQVLRSGRHTVRVSCS